MDRNIILKKYYVKTGLFRRDKGTLDDPLAINFRKIRMLSSETLAAVMSSLRAGQYNLLLGAGVSTDATSGAGELLPGGNDFRLELCALKGARLSSSLQRVFTTLTPDEIEQFVTSRFQNCSPSPSLTKAPSFLWRRIFTFNIDDVLEANYRDPNRLQQPQVFHFDDNYTEVSDLSEVPVVHLHGWVGRPDKSYVFSNSEYVRQIKSINPWMVVLTQFLPVEPFIIIGASLDEVDLEYYLAHRSPTTLRTDRGPSILVEPFPDAVTESDCKKYGLTLFKGTAKEFFDYIDKNTPDRPSAIDLVPLDTQNLFPAGTPKQTIISFSADFEFVKPPQPRGKVASKFLFGHTPSWEDLAGNLDVPREITSKISAEIEKSFQASEREKVILISDDTGTGKSTILRRVAFEFAQKGTKVLTCSALSRIDPQRTAESIDLIDGAVLVIVDNFADQVIAMRDLINRLEKKDVIVLGAERGYRSSYLNRALSDVRPKTIGGLELRFLEAERLLNLFLELGMVGRAEATKNPNSFAKQIFRDPVAVAACRILNDFRPLDRIIKSITADASDVDHKRYLAAALAHFCIRGGVRYEILSSISGPGGWNEQFDTKHPMPLAFYDSSDRSYIVPLNGTLATSVLERASKDNPKALLDVFVSLANAVAPRVNRNAIRRRSPEARLAGRLFDYDQIVHDFLREHSSEFYVRTHDAWRWNSRYWEQVSLLNLARYEAAPSSADGIVSLQQAIQNARHAVSIEEHPFSLSTLGKVLLAQFGATDGSGGDAVFDEAFDRLAAALIMERSWSARNVPPFISLFRGVRDFVNRGGKLSSKHKEILTEFVGEARRLFPRDPDINEAIRNISALAT